MQPSYRYYQVGKAHIHLSGETNYRTYVHMHINWGISYGLPYRVCCNYVKYYSRCNWNTFSHPDAGEDKSQWHACMHACMHVLVIRSNESRDEKIATFLRFLSHMYLTLKRRVSSAYERYVRSTFVAILNINIYQLMKGMLYISFALHIQNYLRSK